MVMRKLMLNTIVIDVLFACIDVVDCDQYAGALALLSLIRKLIHTEQEGIPVGCVPSAFQVPGGVGQTPSQDSYLPCRQTPLPVSRQTPSCSQTFPLWTDKRL